MEKQMEAQRLGLEDIQKSALCRLVFQLVGTLLGVRGSAFVERDLHLVELCRCIDISGGKLSQREIVTWRCRTLFYA